MLPNIIYIPNYTKIYEKLTLVKKLDITLKHYNNISIIKVTYLQFKTKILYNQLIELNFTYYSIILNENNWVIIGFQYL